MVALRSLALLLLPAAASAAPAGPVLVTGATGKTGALLYKTLKAAGVEVRAFVRNATKAKEVLGCQKCDASEGIFLGDILKKETLVPALQGAAALAVTTSAMPICNGSGGQDCHYPEGAFPKQIDFEGLKLQVETFAEARRTEGKALGHVVLCSSMGTTDPDSFLEKIGNGHIGFFKLNGEAALMSSGLPFTIVKPCGLTDGPAGQATLRAGHDDDLKVSPPIVSRADVARVMKEALVQPEEADGLRFDLCSQPGAPTTDFTAFLRSARHAWEPTAALVAV